MKKNFELPVSLFIRVDVNNPTNKTIVTSVVDPGIPLQDRIILRTIQDWRNLKMEYVDVQIDRGMQYFPELNTLFSYLMTLLIDENSNPQDVEIILLASQLQKKGSI